MRRSQIFFKDKFHSIRQRLQQAERADAGWSPAILDVADDLAFQPHGIRHRREQHNECDHDLDHRNENEFAKTQRGIFPDSLCSVGSRPAPNPPSAVQQNLIGGDFFLRRLLVTVLNY